MIEGGNLSNGSETSPRFHNWQLNSDWKLIVGFPVQLPPCLFLVNTSPLFKEKGDSCFAALIALKFTPSLWLVYLMVVTQGVLGYGLTSVMGPVVLEIFQGKHYGSIFGTIMLAALAGGAAGPWATGVLYDLSGNYTIAFAAGIAMSVLSAIAIWQASPGKVRAVAGKMAQG